MRSMLRRSQNELIESVWAEAYMHSMLCRSQNKLIESVWVKAYMIQPVKKAKLIP